jgi:hypothetical protein
VTIFLTSLNRGDQTFGIIGRGFENVKGKTLSGLLPDSWQALEFIDQPCMALQSI